MVSLTIDNRKIEVPAGTKVIEAAERLGIMIPRFCFHPALGSVGACRVCAVAFTEGPVTGVQMSCMVDAQDEMVVSTTDAEAVDFRRQVIEWLMLHHPHDCPVCDEGGHCLLQDLTVSGGHGRRRYQGSKRTHRNQDLGPLVQHEMNRCIQCYRCSRYYQEVTGYRDLGVRGIGTRVYFGRSSSGVLESPFAGNLIDICPTGVYTDKPSRYAGRRWDFQRAPSVCVHCCLGCNLTASARYRRVVRHEARFNREVNGYFICDRGRYGYAYASAADRPRQALAAGTPGEAADVIAAARERIRRAAAQFGPDSVALTASWRCSLETLAMATRACRDNHWTGPAVAPSLRQSLNLQCAVDRLTPELAVSFAALSTADEVVVIGADPVNEAPLLALALRQVHRQGGHVTVIDPRGVQLPLTFDHWPVPPSGLVTVMQALIQIIDAGEATDDPQETEPFPVSALARRLAGCGRAVVVCGTDIVDPEDIALAADLAEGMRRRGVDAGLFPVLAAANAFAAGLIGGAKVNLEQIIEAIEAGRVRVLVVVEQDLWREFADRERLRGALEQLDELILLGHVASPLDTKAASFVPTRTPYESGGHWINAEGRLQAVTAVMAGGEPLEITGALDHPPRTFGRAIPGNGPQTAWQVVADLARESGQDADQDSAQQLKTAMAAFHPGIDPLPSGGAGRPIDLPAEGRGGTERSKPPVQAPLSRDAVTLLLVDWTFGTEPLSATAPALAAVAAAPVARMHPGEIERLGLAAGKTVTVFTDKGRLSVPLQADERMAPGVLVIPRHHRLDWQVLGATKLTLDSDRIHGSG